MSARWPNIILALIVVVGIIICLLIIATRQLNPTESLLLSLVLTISSVIGSWVASRYYSEVTFSQNLRVFALKAAEKVNNLSNELDRLSAFLQHELETTDYGSQDDAVLSKDSTIEAGIHIIATLKSVNDTSLSDWQGVIGEELNAQREEREEREEGLRELIDRVETLSLQIGHTASARDNTAAALSREVNSIKSDLRTLASQVSGVPVRRPKTNRQSIDLPCPRCAHILSYEQKVKEGSYKVIICQGCQTKLISFYRNGAFELNVNEPHSVQAPCPLCGKDVSGMLGLMLGNGVDVNCTNCNAMVRLIRAKNEVRAKPVSPAAEVPGSAETILNDEILKRVQEAMPSQPWEPGATRDAASRLGLPYRIVHDAVEELMDRGIFKLQRAGKLYQPVSRSESD